MDYPIIPKTTKLTKASVLSPKTSDLGVTPVKTKDSFYIPLWALFPNHEYLTNFVDLNELGDDEHVYDTLWIGKNIEPEILYGNITYRDDPEYSIGVLKSLGFEDGRTDSFLEDFFTSRPLGAEVPHSIMITKSIRFPEEATVSIIQSVALGFTNIDGVPVQDSDNWPNEYSWNVYLPASLTEINFNTLENLQGFYTEGEKDRQVHIYLDKHTSVPTVYRATVPVLDDGPTTYNENTNIHFHVNADIYDDFVAAYDGWFREISKIERTVPSWVTSTSKDISKLKEDIADLDIENIKTQVKSSLKDFDTLLTLSDIIFESEENNGETSYYFDSVKVTPDNIYYSDDEYSGLNLDGTTISLENDYDPDTNYSNLTSLLKAVYNSDQLVLALKDRYTEFEFPKRTYFHKADSAELGYDGYEYIAMFGNTGLNPDFSEYPASDLGPADSADLDSPICIEFRTDTDEDSFDSPNWNYGSSFISIYVDPSWLSERLANAPKTEIGIQIPEISTPAVVNYRIKNAQKEFENSYFTKNLEKIPLETVSFMFFEPKNKSDAVVYNYIDDSADIVISNN